jgi:hypothetical protein
VRGRGEVVPCDEAIMSYVSAMFKTPHQD